MPRKPPESKISRLQNSAAFAAITKQFGVKAITLASERKVENIPRLSSGILPLDYALGGGWPIGRISLVYGHKSTGKSTLMTLAAASAQKTCGVCLTQKGLDGSCQCGEFQDMSIVYIDIEGSYEGNWGRNLGCDPDRMLISRPDYAEQALDILEALILSRECDVIILDSIAFLTPAKEIEKSVSEDMVGMQARLSGKAVRKFNSALNTVGNQADGWKPTIFLVNQIRMKVGLLFGCFHANTPVMFADGSQVPIHRVVSERLEGPVLSWDGDQIVERKILDWYENGVLGEGERWLTFRVAGTGGSRGAQGFTCTPNHVLVRHDGEEVRAGDVRVGDQLLSWYEARLTSTEREVVVGSLFGDGHITEEGAFSLSNLEQSDYLSWKEGLFSSYWFTLVRCCGRKSLRTENSFEFRFLREKFYGGSTTREGNRTIPLDELRGAGPMSLAIWYLDDGTYKESDKSASISVKRLTDAHAEEVADVLAERFQGVSYSNTQRAIVLPTSVFLEFSRTVAPYTPRCMEYKLLPEDREVADKRGLLLDCPVLRREPTPVEVQSIQVSRKKHSSKIKYDLQIEGDSFYLVGGDSRGVVVHNSPETQPGGLAWGFAAANEVKVKGGKYKMDEESGRPLYVDLDFRVDKNKCLRGSERVFLPGIGRHFRVEDFARQDCSADVLAVSEDGSIRRAVMEKCWRQPMEDAVYEVSLDTGEVLGANSEHRLLTPEGWVRVGDLKADSSWVAVPKRIPVLEWEGVVEPSLLRACLLGLLVGDGYVGGKTGVYLIKEDPLVVSRLREAVVEFDCEVYLKPGSMLHWGIRQIGGGHKGSENKLHTWLRSVGLWGCRAWEKMLPMEVFGWSEEARGALLGGLFATDGWVEVQKNGSLRTGYVSTSQGLVEQIQQLLLTSGIRSRLRMVPVSRKSGRIGSWKIQSKRPVWRVVVSSDEMVSRFRSLVPWMGSKTFVDYPGLRGRGGKSDRIPRSLAGDAEFFVREGSVSCAQVARVLGFKNPDGESWDRVLRRRLDHISLRSLRAWASLSAQVPKEVQDLLDSDLAWSRVKKIEYVGVEPVYDVSVPGVENLIVSGMVTHNTAVPKMEGTFRMMLSDTETKRKGQIADEGFIIKQCERLGILTGSGSSWTISTHKFKGKKYIETELETNPEFRHEITTMLMTVLLSA